MLNTTVTAIVAVAYLMFSGTWNNAPVLFAAEDFTLGGSAARSIPRQSRNTRSDLKANKPNKQYNKQTAW